MKPYIHQVHYYETDKMGITHHSNYVRYMEEARVDYLNKIGSPFDKIEERGIASPVITLECSYRKTTTFPDDIYIYVRPEKLTAFKLTFSYDMKVKGETVFKGKSSHCFLDTDGKPVALEQSYPELYNALKDEMKTEPSGFSD